MVTMAVSRHGLMTLGVAVGTDRPSLSVYVSSDYLDDEFAGVNREHLESAAPWALIRPVGIQPLFGPVFRPGEKSPCWACLTYRIRNHQEVHSFVRNHCGEAAAFRPNVAEPLVLDVVYGTVAIEIARWLVLGDAAPLHDRAITLDVAGMKSEYHRVMRRPQCPVCGDEELYKTDRPATPVRLQASPKQLRNSGGVRAADAFADAGKVPAPGESGERHRYLGFTHNPQDRPLVACALGRQQPCLENQEPELIAAQPAQQECGQGQQRGAIRGQCAV